MAKLYQTLLDYNMDKNFSMKSMCLWYLQGQFSIYYMGIWMLSYFVLQPTVSKIEFSEPWPLRLQEASEVYSKTINRTVTIDDFLDSAHQCE